jgi:DNA-binding NtrC family response regulator
LRFGIFFFGVVVGHVGQVRQRRGIGAISSATLDAIDRCGGNRNEAAKALGMHKSTFFRKVRALGVTLPEHDGRSGRSGL